MYMSCPCFFSPAGPVTILQWSFARNDVPRAEQAAQLALALRDEVKDLAAAGCRVLQVLAVCWVPPCACCACWLRRLRRLRATAPLLPCPGHFVFYFFGGALP